MVEDPKAVAALKAKQEEHLKKASELKAGLKAYEPESDKIRSEVHKFWTYAKDGTQPTKTYRKQKNTSNKLLLEK